MTDDIIKRLRERVDFGRDGGMTGRWVKLDELAALLDRIAEADEMRDVLLRNGFVECDISACNCGSWHHRYGLPERMREIERVLADAGHELSNENGNSALGALKALIAQRDAAEREIERLRAERDEHARWREKLADDLHERESQISDGWAALRDSGVQSEKNIADGIKLLRAENEALAADARRYRFIRDTPWGPDLINVIQMQMNGKWDAAIDAARREK